jgi:plasmid replication initiation protein
LMSASPRPMLRRPWEMLRAAFTRKLRRYRTEIIELRNAGIVFRPMVWTADGRPHPAATRTLKYAAELAASRNSQQASASSLLGRWRHEVQISILRRRAGMHRAVLPRPSKYEEWLLTGTARHYGNGKSTDR